VLAHGAQRATGQTPLRCVPASGRQRWPPQRYRPCRPNRTAFLPIRPWHDAELEILDRGGALLGAIAAPRWPHSRARPTRIKARDVRGGCPASPCPWATGSCGRSRTSLLTRSPMLPRLATFCSRMSSMAAPSVLIGVRQPAPGSRARFDGGPPAGAGRNSWCR